MVKNSSTRRRRKRKTRPAPAHNLRRIGSALDEQRRLLEEWASEGPEQEQAA